MALSIAITRYSLHQGNGYPAHVYLPAQTRPREKLDHLPFLVYVSDLLSRHSTCPGSFTSFFNTRGSYPSPVSSFQARFPRSPFIAGASTADGRDLFIVRPFRWILIPTRRTSFHSLHHDLSWTQGALTGGQVPSSHWSTWSSVEARAQNRSYDPVLPLCAPSTRTASNTPSLSQGTYIAASCLYPTSPHPTITQPCFILHSIIKLNNIRKRQT